MANSVRLVRGDPQIVKLPKYANDAIDLGDLLYFDATNDAARPAENIGGADYAAKKAAFAAAFVGVAMASAAAGDTGDIPVATAGDFQFPAPGGAAYDVTDKVAVGNGTAVQDQGLVKTTTDAESIGRVIAQKPSAATSVLVRLVPILNKVA